ncbi:unnamed protein product [Bursaphelenchus xylophilus]|uniref:(pine wood nematode) hypothetical protein n=1 Tax=Bursaphelenchus xylophilus TaxID=6326 RepID=A0A1I7SQC9_BURXY|nr:unnamed protein product [Bursaphelenchus xylophilus]CAG9109734.1 unnamed protein product [Bursaphelenchus xylophilus]
MRKFWIREGLNVTMLYILPFTVLFLPFLADSAYFTQFSRKELDRDPCYDSTGRPVRCVPDFINAAFGKPIVASSTCGLNGPAPYCISSQSKRTGSVVEQCDICNAKDFRTSHPASYLTDLNSAKNRTCWISEPTSQYPHNVTLTLSLGKKFELTYISLLFCSKVADSLALYKSTNFGKTWTPFQFFSSECKKIYGRVPEVPIGRHNEQEARCTDAHLTAKSTNQVAFATLENRPSAYNFEHSPVLQDWVTATDIRVVFNRHSPEQADLYSLEDTSNSTELESLEKIEKKYFYALSELAVGGRCKCNGHASRCVFDKSGNYACQCRHNTGGVDCEKCKLFHYDRPWARATAEDANACVACNCNLHARKCRFNMELYRLSGNKSGGVCINCRHNTAGRNCHYCKPGYYRDVSRPITHRKACKPCNCHPVGSLSKNCNQTSGQCICKPGVTGLTCNRCAKGFEQSQSPITPCIPIAATPVTELPTPVCEKKCRATPSRLTQKKYCRRDYAVKANILEKERIGDYDRYLLKIDEITKKKASGAYKIRYGKVFLWVPSQQTKCGCPKLKEKEEYLIMGREISNDSKRPGLSFNKHTLVMEWNEDLADRLERFSRRALHGFCPSSRRPSESHE